MAAAAAGPGREGAGTEPGRGDGDHNAARCSRISHAGAAGRCSQGEARKRAGQGPPHAPDWFCREFESVAAAPQARGTGAGRSCAERRAWCAGPPRG